MYSAGGADTLLMGPEVLLNLCFLDAQIRKSVVADIFKDKRLAAIATTIQSPFVMDNFFIVGLRFVVSTASP